MAALEYSKISVNSERERNSAWSEELRAPWCLCQARRSSSGVTRETLFHNSVASDRYLATKHLLRYHHLHRQTSPC